MSLKSESVDEAVTVDGSVSVGIDDIALYHCMTLVIRSLGHMLNDVIGLPGEPLIVIIVEELGHDGGKISLGIESVISCVLLSILYLCFSCIEEAVVKELASDDCVPVALSVAFGLTLIDRLINYIPCVDGLGISVCIGILDNAVDIGLKSLKKYIPAYKAVLIKCCVVVCCDLAARHSLEILGKDGGINL